MGKFLSAVLILVLAYFAFLKRTEPPEEVPAPEEHTEQFDITPAPQVTSAPQAVASAPVSATIALTGTDSELGDEGSLSEEADGSAELIKDEPKENVDQTIIGNEKRLAEAKSAQEAFDLLRKLRLRIRKLSDISVPATPKDYSKFWGSYEGPVVNNRQEVVFNFKIELKEETSNGQSRIAGNYQILKPGYPAQGYIFSESQFGVQLVGRDALVINSTKQDSYFQFYKLDNGYLAGNYYDRSSKKRRTYYFILKNK